MENLQWRSNNLEGLAAHECAGLASGNALISHGVREHPLENLSSLVSKFDKANKVAKENKEFYEIYKGTPIHFYQKDNDEWVALVEWSGRSANIELEAWEEPTREAVLGAAHRLINLLGNSMDNGVVWPKSHFK